MSGLAAATPVASAGAVIGQSAAAVHQDSAARRDSAGRSSAVVAPAPSPITMTGVGVHFVVVQQQAATDADVPPEPIDPVQLKAEFEAQFGTDHNILALGDVVTQVKTALQGMRLDRFAAFRATQAGRAQLARVITETVYVPKHVRQLSEAVALNTGQPRLAQHMHETKGLPHQASRRAQSQVSAAAQTHAAVGVVPKKRWCPEWCYTWCPSCCCKKPAVDA